MLVELILGGRDLKRISPYAFEDADAPCVLREHRGSGACYDPANFESGHGVGACVGDCPACVFDPVYPNVFRLKDPVHES